MTSTTHPVEGAVAGTPRRFLRVEGATLAVGALVAYRTTGEAWWLFPAALLAPDLSMLAFLAGPRSGARAYNLAHATPIPALLVGLGWWQDLPLLLALGLIWLAHVGLDRLLGYGLKYGDHFQHTHLGQIGKATR